MKVAQSARSPIFGARFQIPATSTHGEIDAELQRLQELIERMAAR